MSAVPGRTGRASSRQSETGGGNTMGYANHVGRVGALAVALGIGAAVASTAGMAWAQDEGGDPGSQSQDSTPAGDPAPEAAGENPGGGGGDLGPGDPPSQPVGETQPEETGTTGLTTTTGGDSPTVTISSSGGSLTSNVFRQLRGEAAPPAEESHPHVPQQQPVAVTRAAKPMTMAIHPTEPAMDMDMPDMDPAMDMPGMHDGMDMHHMQFVPISSLGELFSVSRRTEDEKMMLNKRLSATLMPGLFLETMPMDDGPDMLVYNDLSDFVWNMAMPMPMGCGGMDMPGMPGMDMDCGMSMSMKVDCEGGMDMSGMAGMDMDCDSMDHSMTPMMLVTAQGEVKPAEAMGHAGHDMGSMPAEAMPGHDMSAMPAESMPAGHDMSNMPAEAMPGHDMSNMPAESMPPGHDMSNMPAESMPPGHDMSNMPGHDMSDMPPPAVIPDNDTTPPNVALGSDPVHNDGDVRFAQHMVPHHSQAVEMIDIILAKPDLDPRVRDLALKIKADEVPEISAMKGWLKLWGNPAMLPNPHGTHGILSAAEIAQLKAAPGAAAGILFLKEMISHHEGAIAASEVQIGEGKNRPALTLAESIVEQQKADIVLMKSYLASPGQPAAPAPKPVPAPGSGIGAHAGQT